MTKPAKRSANGDKNLAAEIEWEFTFDRFGVRPERDAGESLKVEFAREAVRSLSYWFQTVELLYDDTTEVMTLATNAGLLPQYPYWQSVAQTTELLQNWLTAVGLAAKPIDQKIVEPRTEDFVEQLRLYLEAMPTWAPVFRAATWVASLAGTGSIMPSAQGRLLQGLKSVIAVYEFDATLDPAEILKRFDGILSGDVGEVSPLQPQLRRFLKQGKELLHYSGPTLSAEPARLYQWLQEFREAAQDYPHQSVVPATSWDAVEDAYWRQWRWPSIGAVSRVTHGETNAASASAGGTSAGVSALDVIYTTRYGSVPLLHWRGGNLSICQWSRILTIGSLRGTTALQAPSVAAVGNLGFSEPSTPPENASGAAVGGPIMMISPFSENSAVWDWRPEPGVRAFALVPRRLAEGDENASRSGSEVTTPVEAVNDGWAEIATRVAQVRQHATAFLHFVETAGGERAGESPAGERLPWAPWKRVGFGSGPAEPSERFISERPHSAAELVEFTRKHYPEVFPTPPDEDDTAFGRFLYQLGRSLRSMQYEMRREFARIARLLGLAKRSRRVAAFLQRLRDSLRR